MFLLLAAIAITVVSTIVIGSLSGEAKPLGGVGAPPGQEQAKKQADEDKKKREEEKKKMKKKLEEGQKKWKSFFQPKAFKVSKTNKKALKENNKSKNKSKVENMGALPTEKVAGAKSVGTSRAMAGAPLPTKTISSPVSISKR